MNYCLLWGHELALCIISRLQVIQYACVKGPVTKETTQIVPVAKMIHKGIWES